MERWGDREEKELSVILQILSESNEFFKIIICDSTSTCIERNVSKPVCKSLIQTQCREKEQMRKESHKGTCYHVVLGVRQVLSGTKSGDMMYTRVLKDACCFLIVGQTGKMKKKYGTKRTGKPPSSYLVPRKALVLESDFLIVIWRHTEFRTYKEIIDSLPHWKHFSESGF